MPNQNQPDPDLIERLDALHEAATDPPWRTERDPTSYPALYGPEHPRSIASLEMVTDAAQKMADQSVRHLLVTYKGVLQGVLGYRDVVEADESLYVEDLISTSPPLH